MGFVPLLVAVHGGGGRRHCCPPLRPWGHSCSMSPRSPPGRPVATPQCGDGAAAPPPPPVPAATAHLGVRSPQPQGSGHPTAATRRPAERIGSTGRYRGGGHKVGHAAATKPRVPTRPHPRRCHPLGVTHRGDPVTKPSSRSPRPHPALDRSGGGGRDLAGGGANGPSLGWGGQMARRGHSCPRAGGVAAVFPHRHGALHAVCPGGGGHRGGHTESGGPPNRV